MMTKDSLVGESQRALTCVDGPDALMKCQTLCLSFDEESLG